MGDEKSSGAVRYMTVVEAAEYLSMTPAALYRLTAERSIPMVRLSERKIRFDRHDLDRWMEKHKTARLP